MKIIVIGGGIGGLTLALMLKQRGLSCQVYEAAPVLKPLGVGITLLPHAMREFCALGLESKLRAVGIENHESVFFNRHGQFIYSEQRGNFAGYAYPELGVNRGKLHSVLIEEVQQQLGSDAIIANHCCSGVFQRNSRIEVSFKETTTGKPLGSADGAVAIACDGVNSAVRRQFYPEEKWAFAGINTWRGVTKHPPIFKGRAYIRIGSIETGKIVLYPIADNVDGRGNQLINWVCEIKQAEHRMNGWNQPGGLQDFLYAYKDWKFDWLDVPQMISNADQIFEYPMVDKDPVLQWTFGLVTLLGDAAHPMYPRGSNGAAQAIIDARTLADLLSETNSPTEALSAYEQARLAATAQVVQMNRQHPPDYIITKVEELTGGKPFTSVCDVISQRELQTISEDYKKIAGFSLESLQRA